LIFDFLQHKLPLPLEDSIIRKKESQSRNIILQKFHDLRVLMDGGIEICEFIRAFNKVIKGVVSNLEVEEFFIKAIFRYSPLEMPFFTPRKFSLIPRPITKTTKSLYGLR
jgi:hypothetical protein